MVFKNLMVMIFILEFNQFIIIIILILINIQLVN